MTQEAYRVVFTYGAKANLVQKSTFPTRIVCLTVWLLWEWVVPCAISCRGGWKLNFNRLNGPSFLSLHCFDLVVVLFEASSCKVDRTQWNEYTQTMEMYACSPSSMLWESNLKAVCALSLPLGFRYLLCFGQRIDQSLFLFFCFFCLCVCVCYSPSWGFVFVWMTFRGDTVHVYSPQTKARS